jgi:hypothetical protein
MFYEGALKSAKNGENWKNGNVLAHGGKTNGAIAKQTPPLESTHQIGLSTLSKDKLIIVGECFMGVL